MSEGGELSWKKPLILAAALCVAGAAAIWSEFTYAPKKEAREESAKKPLDLAEQSIQSITIQDGSRARFTFECQDLAQKLCRPGDASKWRVLEPIQAIADENNVNSLVSNLNNLISTEIVSLKEETPAKRAALLKDYGLAAEARASKSARYIQVTLADGKTKRFDFGELHPLGDTNFALSDQDENRVFLIPSHAKTNFESDLTYWRNKKLFSLTPGKVARFEFSGPKGKLKGKRGTGDAQGEWTLETSKGGAKQSLAGDIESVDTFLSSALFATARDFRSEDKNSAGAKRILQGARAILTLDLYEEGKPETDPSARSTLTLYRKGTANKDAATYATSSAQDALFSVDPALVNRLDKDVKDLRLSRLISSIDQFNSSKIALEGKRFGDKPFVLMRNGDTWAREGDSNYSVAPEKVSMLLDQLSGKKVRDFLASTADTGPADAVTVTLSDVEKTRRKFRFWRVGAAAYARDLLADRPETLVVEPAVLDALPATIDAFRKGYVDPKAAAANAAGQGAPAAPDPHGDGAH